MASKPSTRPCRPIERRPPMLKDFLLRDDANSSSTGFKSFPRRLSWKDLQQPAGRRCGEAQGKLQRSRSRSRAAADATISAFQKLLNAVRSLPLPAVKSPSKNKKKNAETVVQVTVKDILRWKSFRDLIDSQEDADSADLRPRSGGRAGSTCGIVGFTAEEWGDGRLGETWNVGRMDPMRKGTGIVAYSDVGLTKQQELEASEDHEQHSPVSVLDSPFRDDEEPISSFDQTLASVERTRARLLQSIKWFENLAGLDPANLDEQFQDQEATDHQVEEEDPIGADSRARRLMQETGCTGDTDSNIDKLLFDFFMDELGTKRCCHRDNKLETRVVNEARAYLSKHGGKDMEEMDECIRDTEKEAQWSTGKFDEQHSQLGVELEIGVLNALLDEVLFDLVGGSDC